MNVIIISIDQLPRELIRNQTGSANFFSASDKLLVQTITRRASPNTRTTSKEFRMATTVVSSGRTGSSPSEKAPPQGETCVTT